MSLEMTASSRNTQSNLYSLFISIKELTNDMLLDPLKNEMQKYILEIASIDELDSVWR